LHVFLMHVNCLISKETKYMHTTLSQIAQTCIFLCCCNNLYLSTFKLSFQQLLAKEKKRTYNIFTHFLFNHLLHIPKTMVFLQSIIQPYNTYTCTHTQTHTHTHLNFNTLIYFIKQIVIMNFKLSIT
jgi:hypothetical protein